jgi:hypothetical protein
MSSPKPFTVLHPERARTVTTMGRIRSAFMTRFLSAPSRLVISFLREKFHATGATDAKRGAGVIWNSGTQKKKMGEKM